MKNLDAGTLAALTGLLGVIVTSLVGVIQTKLASKKDLTVADRQRLSQDQQNFYEMVIREVTVLRERSEKLEQELQQYRTQTIQLTAENSELRSLIRVLESKVAGREFREEGNSEKE